MRHNSLVVVGVVFALAFVTMASQPAAASEDDVAAINKVREMEATSLNEASVEHVEMIYTADVDYMPPGEPALKGADAVSGWLTAMLEQFDGNLEYTSSEIKVSGDWAVEKYGGKITLTPKAGGDPMVANVRGVHIYSRGDDGAWRIAHDLWNMDTPAH